MATLSKQILAFYLMLAMWFDRCIEKNMEVILIALVVGMVSFHHYLQFKGIAAL